MAGRHAKPRRSHLGPIASAAVVASVLVGGVVGAAHFAPQWIGASAPTPVVTSAEASPSSASSAASPTPAAATPSAAKPSPSHQSTRAPERASRNTTRAAAPSPTKTTARVVTSGTCGASYYDQGQVTANGEQFNPEALTGAHKTLAFNTRVRVTNPGNGKSVVVRINDRGPFVGGRCLDLSRAAFRAIAPLGMGELTVKYEILGQ